MRIIDPLRGEIWWVSLDPTVGAEIKKRRPALVVSSDKVRSLPLRLVAPITDWSGGARRSWHVRIPNRPENGLSKESAVDCLQLRSLDLSRFDRPMGVIDPEEMRRVAEAIALMIEI